jgi:hypothetical protein
MGWIKRLAAVLLGAALAACGGGGGDAGAPPFGGGGGGGGTAATADLILELSKATVANTGSDSVIVTVTALDASRNTITTAPVQVTADSDAIVTSPNATTGADGKLQATLTIGANRSNRVITVTATSGAVTKTASVQVFGAKITSTLVPPVVAPGATGKIQYRLVDQAGSPMVGESIIVTASSFTPASATGTTGVNGDYEFTYQAPSTPGSYTVLVEAGGTSENPPTTVTVQAASSVPDASPQPVTSASVSANPSVVATNLSGSTSNRSEIRALFLSTANQPVRNVRVKFDLNGDPNTIGGSFTTGRETLYSDANGVVTTAYAPGTRSSPTNGVTVRACYYTTDAAAASDPYDASGRVTTCANAAFVSLTVTAEPLGVSIGTNELIIVGELTYTKKYLVSVVDSAGRALPDVDLVVSLDLNRYRKGTYDLVGDKWVKNETIACQNEDVNRNGVLEARDVNGDGVIDRGEDANGNGVLDVGEDLNGNGLLDHAEDINGNGVLDSGEDLNGNGVLDSEREDIDRDGRLEPGKSDVSVSLLHAKTRADGTAELQILYAKSFGSWIDAVITVAASGVAGTEGRATYIVQPIPVDAASLGNKDVPPAFVRSPYGRNASCANPN